MVFQVFFRKKHKLFQKKIELQEQVKNLVKEIENVNKELNKITDEINKNLLKEKYISLEDLKEILKNELNDEDMIDRIFFKIFKKNKVKYDINEKKFSEMFIEFKDNKFILSEDETLLEHPQKMKIFILDEKKEEL